MLWVVDPSSNFPLYEQLAASVRREIARGTVTRGDRLPAAREVASSLDINLHTVLRAYQALRDDGLIDLRRGRGAVVIADDDGHVRLMTMADDFLAEARRVGVGQDELMRILGERAGR